MKICIYRKYKILWLMALLIFLVLPVWQLNSQTINYKNLYKSKFINEFYEIGRVDFKNNNKILTEELSRIVLSKSTMRSIPHRLVQYYLENMIKSKNFPDYYKNKFEEVQFSMSEEIKYFDENKANNDASTLIIYYNQKGYHNSNVKYTFEPDTTNKINVLTFIIEENQPYKIKSLQYFGLDSLPDDLKKAVDSKKNLSVGDIFSEDTLMNDVSQIHRILLDNGYYYTNYETPGVYIDSLNMTDSITVNFNTGKRQRITNIYYIDSLKGQALIVKDFKEHLTMFKEGEWYSYSKIRQSEENLLNLGTFELVKIDTSSRRNPKTDSTLSFEIFNQYKKQQEYGVGLFLNTSPSSSFLNYGFELSYTHRNLGGIAQEFNPFARFLFKSNSFANLTPVDNEYQFGINFSQPIIFTIDQARIGAGTQFLYSYRTLNQILKLKTLTLPIRFPFRLLVPTTYFRTGNIEFTFEYQLPENYDNFSKDAYQSAKTKIDSLRVQEVLVSYKNLNLYLNRYSPLLTSNIIGASIFGDTRDNPFSPSKGYFSGIFLDGTNFLFSNFLYDISKISGVSKYYRFQFTNYWFWGISKRSTIAVKQRLGLIYWWDKQNTYVPLERQFFAGGANSVRGWPSRRLRYLPNDISFKDDLKDFALDYIGNGTLIEGSLEYRFKIGKIQALGGAIGDQVANTGFVAFVDVGNAFQWMMVDENGNYVNQNKWYEYITGLAIAAGVGFRYDTPVGPFRVDFALPVYDPSLKIDKFIFTRKDVIKSLQFHIALGHAF
jgi:outer membrane protein insertion porin family